MPRWVWLWAALVALRGCAVFSPGYVHPDEYFQNQEVMGAWLLGLDDSGVPWEFTATQPARSIVPP